VVELKTKSTFKKQLEKAEDRESKANARIDTLLTLIEMKPPTANMTTFTDQETCNQAWPKQIQDRHSRS
jgi:hypothetical protein